jgi:hypothetical protein
VLEAQRPARIPAVLTVNLGDQRLEVIAVALELRVQCGRDLDDADHVVCIVESEVDCTLTTASVLQSGHESGENVQKQGRASLEPVHAGERLGAQIPRLC